MKFHYSLYIEIFIMMHDGINISLMFAGCWGYHDNAWRYVISDHRGILNVINPLLAGVHAHTPCLL